MGAERLEIATIEEMVNAERDFERAEVEAARSGILPTLSSSRAEEIEWDLEVELCEPCDEETLARGESEPAPTSAPPDNVFQLELFLARVDHHSRAPQESDAPPSSDEKTDRRTAPPPPDWDPIQLSNWKRI
jgi:hypothetical protein